MYAVVDTPMPKPPDTQQAEADAYVGRVLAETDKLAMETELLAMQMRETLANRSLADQDRLRSSIESRCGEELYVIQDNARRAVECERLLARLNGTAVRRVYDFMGGVDEGNVARCYGTLSAWHDEDVLDGTLRPIRLVLHSPGGAVMTGFRLYDHLSELRALGHELTTVVRGVAGSMGAVLLQAGDVRIMGAESVLLVHELSGGANGSAGTIADTVKLMELLTSRVLNIFASRTKLSAAEIKKRWSRTDWWMGSDEALAKGLVDRVA